VIRTRLAAGRDAAFIEAMLVEAVNSNPNRPRLDRSAALAIPENRRYVEGWPRLGDAGVIAEDDDHRPVGAAWFRFFHQSEPGYGFISRDIPEVSIAVAEAARRRGIGDRLLTELEHEARARSLYALSLSVEVESPAVRLYERHGYRVVETVGTSYTMRLDL
jgi:ribosomal protein S18 acetylase RimI-like enzyme